MVHNIVQNKRFLQSLKRASHVTRKKLLNKATNSEIKAIQEIALNLVKKKIPLQKRVLSKLTRHKSSIKALASRKGSIKRKRKILIQKGGAFLPALLSTALGFLAQNLLNG